MNCRIWSVIHWEISQYFIHSELQFHPVRLWIFLKPVMYDLHQELLRIVMMFIHQLAHIGRFNLTNGTKFKHFDRTKEVILRVAGMPHKLENGSTI